MIISSVLSVLTERLLTLAPCGQVNNLSPIRWIITVPEEIDCSCIVCELHLVVTLEPVGVHCVQVGRPMAVLGSNRIQVTESCISLCI